MDGSVQTGKIVVIGVKGAGKSTFCNKFRSSIYPEFNQNGGECADIPRQFSYRKIIGTAQLEIQVWQCGSAEQLKFQASKSMCAIALLDLKQPADLQINELSNLIRIFRESAHPKAYLILIGTKMDDHKTREIEHDEAVNFARNQMAICYIQISALSNIGVQESFDWAAEYVLKFRQLYHGCASNVTSLDQPSRPRFTDSNAITPINQSEPNYGTSMQTVGGHFASPSYSDSNSNFVQSGNAALKASRRSNGTIAHYMRKSYNIKSPSNSMCSNEHSHQVKTESGGDSQVMPTTDEQELDNSVNEHPTTRDNTWLQKIQSYRFRSMSSNEQPHVITFDYQDANLVKCGDYVMTKSSSYCCGCAFQTLFCGCNCSCCSIL